MQIVVVSIAALLVSGLTFFSEFGLSTLLVPVFAVFFPVPVAVAATAAIHLANNLFRLTLVGHAADRGIVLRFAIPGAIAAVFGAALLTVVADLPPLFTYQVAGRTAAVEPVRLVIGVLIVVFALLDLMPGRFRLNLEPKHLYVGGAASGFFGGLSGHQGALRSAFLIKMGLSTEAFVGTSVASAVIVDVARLIVYGVAFYADRLALLQPGIVPLVIAATLSAFAGSFIGSRLIEKVTIAAVQKLVGAMLILLGIGLATGLI